MGLAQKLPHDNSVFLKPSEKILNRIVRPVGGGGGAGGVKTCCSLALTPGTCIFLYASNSFMEIISFSFLN